MRERLTANALRALGVLVVVAALTAAGGCDSLFNGLGADTSLDGTWNVVLQSPAPGVPIPSFTVTIQNGQPSSIAMPFLPAPLNALTIALDGTEKGIPGVVSIMGSGSVTHSGSSVTVVITLKVTYAGQTAEGTLTLNGTISGNTITGTATGTGTVPGMTVPADATVNFTMTKQ